MKEQDVFNAGTGMAERRAVTRYKSALTGQDMGRGRSFRSFCVSCVATLKSVRGTVAGWAVASAVWDSVCVRRAWWRTEAAHDRRSRMALARNVGAEVRSLWRSHLTALLSFSPFPRAQ